MYSEISGIAAAKVYYRYQQTQIMHTIFRYYHTLKVWESENRKVYFENALMKSDLKSGCSKRGGFWE